jgi:uroporphyrinogen III methyltransferase/synthase
VTKKKAAGARSQEPEARSRKRGARAKSGRVSLVGAGPGDPGLITVAGLERIREADVIVYDRLVNRRLLDHAREGAELIDVGKIPGESHDQEAINRLLIKSARAGKRVVRLKGGDPFVFGRGGEEAEALRAAGIEFDVVPGVTSAVAVPAYAGIPVTHRGVAQSFAVITGHEAEEQQTADSKQQAVLPTADTLVFLMGVKTLSETVRKLTEAGRSSDTPVAVIRWGTTPDQQTVVGTLADIADRVEEAGITPPAITVVGEVVRLRDTISWFESKPLFGKRVLITRTRKQASVLAKLLADEGAIPIELPSIEIQPSYDQAVVEDAIEALSSGDYAWTVFTSANAVDIWMGLAQDLGYDARLFGGTNIAAIGPATAKKLAGYGIIADLVPDEYVAEGIVKELGRRWKPGKRPIGFVAVEDAGDDDAIDAFLRAITQETAVARREVPGQIRVLVPRAEDARPELIEGLRGLGVEVDEVTLYRAVVPSEAPADALEMLRRGEIDIVTFTSSSTVQNLVELLVDSSEENSRTKSAMKAGTTSHDMVTIVGLEGVKQIRADHIIFANEGDDVPPEFDAFLEKSYREWKRKKKSVIKKLLTRPLIACIGPITAETARDLGLRVDVEAAEHTVEGLVTAVLALVEREAFS